MSWLSAAGVFFCISFCQYCSFKPSPIFFEIPIEKFNNVFNIESAVKGKAITCGTEAGIADACDNACDVEVGDGNASNASEYSDELRGIHTVTAGIQRGIRTMTAGN
jgi:hypothetical protein